METYAIELYREWGVFGIVLVICAFIIYDKFFKQKPEHSNTTEMLFGEVIKTSLETFKDNISDKIDNIYDRIDIMEEKFDDKIEDLNRKVNDIPVQNFKIINQHNQEIESFQSKLHTKAIEDVMKLGPKIYDLLNDSCVKIHCTHLFVGSFHNGSSDLNGFPYIKMNIIREAYHPNEMIKEDHPFAPVYKDCDLSLLGKLPSLLVQKKLLYFSVNDLNSEIFKYDSLIGRRMIGMGIKQIAMYGLFEKDKISGFIGCVRYDNDKMNMSELKKCVRELELIHNTSDIKSELEKD